MLTPERLDYLIENTETESTLHDGERAAFLKDVAEALRGFRERLSKDAVPSRYEALLAGHEMVMPVQWEERRGHSVLRASSEPFDIAWASDEPKAVTREEIERAYGIVHLREAGTESAPALERGAERTPTPQDTEPKAIGPEWVHYENSSEYRVDGCAVSYVERFEHGWWAPNVQGMHTTRELAMVAVEKALSETAEFLREHRTGRL